MPAPPSRLLLASLLIVAACSTPEPFAAPEEAPPQPPTTTTVPEPSTTTTSPPQAFEYHPELGPNDSLVALITRDTPVYAESGDDEPFMVQERSTILGTTTVLAVVTEPEGGWVEVMLPVRPNGSSGWIETEDVHFFVVSGRIVIDLDERELVYYQDGEEALRHTVAIGTARNPTPTGLYYVTDSVRVGRPEGPWGPYALGISARSETITEFNGGDGIVGIHGTNQPTTIGQAVSLGCIRLPNDVMTDLYELVPIGTPVEIKATA